MAENDLRLTHRTLIRLHRNYEATARVINLVYIRDNSVGIERMKKGKGFCYWFEGERLVDKQAISRIRKLAIPPAWTGVWICPLENGHIQATGLDLRGREQYRYHHDWNLLRNETKFHRLQEFGKALPLLRRKLEEDLTAKPLNQEKVLATAISLMERTYIRIGNSGYEKMYGSYGLTTLKDKHVEIKGDRMTFSFKGKKGISHEVTLRNKRLARTVKACRDIPGKELFQYYDADGNRQSIDSGMVNNYLKSAMGADFTAKDFRTWAGTIQALICFQRLGRFESEAHCKKNILDALDQVSRKLGNTRTVCKKYYVHPGLIQLYAEDSLQKFLQEDSPSEPAETTEGLNETEIALLRILRHTNFTDARRA